MTYTDCGVLLQGSGPNRHEPADHERNGLQSEQVALACCKPKNEQIAAKVINHLGDEVMKVFTV
jgi:hypothetical protein